jgi:glycosyltransferase involved in cell wall biosynthesis
MRICLYTETALPLVGGQELVVDTLARVFLALGHEVVVLAAQHRGRLPNRDHELPYKVVRHPRFISTHRLLDWYKRYLERLRKTFPFDVLHCHSVQPAGYVAASSANLHDVPLVITSHWGDITPTSPRLAKPGALGRCKIALHRADAIAAISGAVAERVVELGASAERVVRISNGVHVAQFTTAVARPATVDPAITASCYLLFLGRITHQKGVDMLLQAYQLAVRESSARLVIAGNGVELVPMRQLAAQLGIGDRVHFTGHVEGDAKTWLLQNTIATVMPSRQSEGCPLVALESMAAGRPIVASRIPGLEDLVVPGRTGHLVSPGSPTELAEALRDTVVNAAKTTQMGKAARTCAQQHDWPLIARRYCDLFEQLKKRGSRATTSVAA